MTNPTRTDLMKPDKGAELMLYTCTPIGGVTGRWVVQATLDTPEFITQTSTKTLRISYTVKAKIDKALFSIAARNSAERKAIVQKLLPIVRQYKQNRPSLYSVFSYLERELIAMLEDGI